jgi:outer membrane murein-binding lipoprotein Lpp
MKLIIKAAAVSGFLALAACGGTEKGDNMEAAADNQAAALENEADALTSRPTT